MPRMENATSETSCEGGPFAFHAMTEVPGFGAAVVPVGKRMLASGSIP